MSDEMTALDLFCGCGGLTLGLQNSGFEVIGGVDNWPTALETYRQNFAHPALNMDVKDLNRASLRAELGMEPDVDLLAGGPPCQGFSIQRIGEDKDIRNNLVITFAQAVATLKPKMFLMENVPGLLGKRGKALLSVFLTEINRAGYNVVSSVLNASDYGVPQLRRRVFFVGWNKQLAGGFTFPAPTQRENCRVSVRDAIGDLPIPQQRGMGADPLHYETKLSALNRQRIAMIPPGKGFESLPQSLRASCHKNGADAIGHRFVYGRMSPDTPAPTITARFDSFTRGRFGHPMQPRNISLREGARLQTFPDDFKFVGSQEEIAAQIGNAVPPVWGSILGRAVRSFLARESVGTPILQLC